MFEELEDMTQPTQIPEMYQSSETKSGNWALERKEERRKKKELEWLKNIQRLPTGFPPYIPASLKPSRRDTWPTPDTYEHPPKKPDKKPIKNRYESNFILPLQNNYVMHPIFY